MSPPPSLREGQVLTGALFHEPMRVETVQPSGGDAWTVGLVGLQTERFRRVTLTSADVESLTVLQPAPTYDGDGTLLRLGLQAYVLGIAYEFDPYFGLSISHVDPLPHQLEAVYDYLLRLGRVRFLRAEQDRSPDFLRLANSLSALYPRGSEEKRLLDAMLLAVPR